MTMLILFFSSLLAFSHAAPAVSQPISETANKDSSTSLEEQLKRIQDQLSQLQSAFNPVQKSDGQAEEVIYPESSLVQQGISYSEPKQYRAVGWQPMRRLVAWQPMKKAVGWQPFRRDSDAQSRDQVITTIEQKLNEVLRAGEKLGVSPDEVLAHLRARNVAQHAE